jgi:DNA-binding CsgD family transcriptional regulator
MTAQRHLDRALAQLRRMACMDAGGPQRIAPVLHALHGLIGFDSGGYLYRRSDGELDIHMENPAMRSVMPALFEPRVQHSERQVMRRSARLLDEALRCERGVQMQHDLVKVPLAELRRSDYYNAVLRPGEVEMAMKLPLRTADGRGIGILWLYRRDGERRFTGDEAAVLGRLAPGLARALQPGRLEGAEAHDAEVCGQGLLVVTAMGRPLWLAPGTEALLAQAFGWRWRGCGGALPAALQVLVQRLFLPNVRPGVPLPQMDFSNAHGVFSLRATHLAGSAGEADAAAIHITRRVPGGTRLLERLGALGLPRRQAELACWLARGLSEAQIAERMGVSVNTVTYHRRHLYAALGVQDRQGLLRCVHETTPAG